MTEEEEGAEPDREQKTLKEEGSFKKKDPPFFRLMFDNPHLVSNTDPF